MSAKHAIISEQGRRSHMEDTYYFSQNFGGSGQIFGGVYDGHCGKTAAEYVAYNLHAYFLEAIKLGLSPQEAFIKSYEKISSELKNQHSGACAVNFFIEDGKIFFANAGDARLIVVSKNSVQELTTDHRLGDEAERERIVKMGGSIDYPYSPYVYRGNRGLMPTRTIGDEYFKPVGIISEPAVGFYETSEQDLFLIAACDGLYDEMTNEDVAEFSRNFDDPQSLAEGLKKEVLVNRLGSDNLTIIVLSLTSK